LSKEDCKYIAHRGLSEFAPENSLAAFGLALRSNYDSLELDVWATTDQEFVVSHNQSLLNACGVDVNVTDMTLAQATSYRIINGNGVESYPSERIPSLNQVLDLAQIYPGRNISIELKQVFSKEMLEKLLEDIKQRDLQDRVKLITFYRANLSTIRSLEEFGGDEIALEYLVSSPREEALDICEKYHADYGVKYTGLTQEQVKKIHDLGLKVNVWTVSDYLDAYHMVHTMKVDYLTTDYQFFQ
jgi:glycerophosphoryl diester phosphodiesterase